jgi:hypothetical protein
MYSEDGCLTALTNKYTKQVGILEQIRSGFPLDVFKHYIEYKYHNLILLSIPVDHRDIFDLYLGGEMHAMDVYWNIMKLSRVNDVERFRASLRSNTKFGDWNLLGVYKAVCSNKKFKDVLDPVINMKDTADWRRRI